MRVITSLLILIVIAVMIGFAFFNAELLNQNVRIQLPNDYIQGGVPLLTVFFWIFISGILLSAILFVTMFIKQYNQLRQTKKLVTGLQTEVTALRNRPIEETKNLLGKTDGVELKGDFQE